MMEITSRPDMIDRALEDLKALYFDPETIEDLQIYIDFLESRVYSK